MRIQQHPNTGKRTLIESNGYPTIEAVSGCQGRFSMRMVKFLDKLSLAHRLARDGIFYRVEEFLGLSTGESEYIELKLAVSQTLAKRRKKSKVTPAQLAKVLKSSQSRVAKMEKGDPSVSVDLLVRSLLTIGANKESIAKAIV